MADIKSFKSTAGEVFVCFNERSHNYKLFLNMLKGAEINSDTAIRSMAATLTKAINEAKIENQAKGVVATNNGSNGGISHNTLTNISNKMDLLFNSLSGLKSLKIEPVEHKLDTEVLDVFGQRLEESLGALISSKISAMPAPVASPSLPDDFADKVIASLANNKAPDLSGIQASLTKFQENLASEIKALNTKAAPSIDLSEINQKLADFKTILMNSASSIDLSPLNQQFAKLHEALKNKTLVSAEARTEQVAAISHTTIPSKEPSVSRDKLLLEKEAVVPPVQTTVKQEPTAVAGKDMVMRYPAKSKKSKPSCYGEYLAGDIETTPCLSCAWTNDCSNQQKSTVADKKSDKANKTDKPDCFGSHQGDLECSVCKFDGECASKS